MTNFLPSTSLKRDRNGEGEEYRRKKMRFCGMNMTTMIMMMAVVAAALVCLYYLSTLEDGETILRGSIYNYDMPMFI